MATTAVTDAEQVLAAIEDVAEERIAPLAAEIDRERRYPRASLEALAEIGAMGLVVPAEHGGAGGGFAELARACEAIGSACASTGMTFLMHSVAAATVAGGGGTRADELLPRLAGGAIGTLAFSERGTGAHFYAPEIRARRADGALRVEGRKSFVTSGGEADVYLLLVGDEGGEAADCYAVDADRPGLSFSGAWEGLGMAGNSSVAMRLDGLELTDADRIGAPGGGADLVFGVVAPWFLVGLAAVNVGIAGAATAAATGHVTSRRYPDGGALAEVQTIQHALAEMDMTARGARLLVAEAARLGDAGDEAALVPMMEAKVAATEAAVAVTQLALEACGGQAYGPGLPIERHLRDARAGGVMAPTNGVLRNWIGKAVAGLPVP
jgi:alkylation response protein AidB-like acyl-CoA dehydrogenase